MNDETPQVGRPYAAPAITSRERVDALLTPADAVVSDGKPPICCF